MASFSPSLRLPLTPPLEPTKLPTTSQKSFASPHYMPKRPRRIRRPAANSFQPLQTFIQILALQGLYYAIATALILFSALVAGHSFSLDLVFSSRSVQADNTVGWTLGIVWLLCSMFMLVPILAPPPFTWRDADRPRYRVIAQVLVHARSKLVLDFSLTLHFLHLVIISLHDHEIPRSWLWWGLQATSTTLMVSVGTWACRWRELRPIPFGGNGPARGVGEGSSSNTRGAGDGGGNYEMVQMKGDGEV